MAVALAHGEKPPKFSGAYFKRCQQKMLFYLTTLGLSRFLKDDPPPSVEDDEVDNNRRIVVDVWNNSDFLCCNYVLNGPDNTLYNVYSTFKTSKKLWDSLEKKYKTEDVGTKKFIVGKFLEYKMVDTKTVISQVQEIQIILHDLVSEGMEDKANLTESSTSKQCKHSGKEKGKAKNFKGNCYNCCKPNHMAKDCQHPKKGNQGGNQQANVTEDKSNIFPNKERKEKSSSKRTYGTARLPQSDDEEEPRRSKRTKVSKSFGPDFLTYMLENEPRTIQEVLSSPEAPLWKEAINNEIDSIMQNHT
ncbi:hypothetical protein DH2020_016412 [Rehmannia glutinosa]|uniref:CCHC-type domain-containing protein n=1 Tax=Rehmannia glutinosa TaxID=99300 RepID=A0ABR0WRC6_REHGL